MAGNREDSLSATMAKISLDRPTTGHSPMEATNFQDTINTNVSHVNAIEMKHFQIYVGEPMKILVEQVVDGTIAIDDTEKGHVINKSTVNGVCKIETRHYQIYMGQLEQVNLIQKYIKENEEDINKEEYLSTIWMQRKTCEEVHEILVKMGVENPDKASRCVKAAIQNGFIQVTGDPTELDKIVYSVEHPDWGHIKARLGDILNQPDFGGGPCDTLLEGATVAYFRTEKEIEIEVERKFRKLERGEKVAIPFPPLCWNTSEGRAYITNICSGFPMIDTTGCKHNHCDECAGFGVCLLDYRNAHCNQCGEHYFAGTDGVLPCDNCPGLDDTSDSEGYLTFR